MTMPTHSLAGFSHSRFWPRPSLVYNEVSLSLPPPSLVYTSVSSLEEKEKKKKKRGARVVAYLRYE